jgi:hypothetical protein
MARLLHSADSQSRERGGNERACCRRQTQMRLHELPTLCLINGLSGSLARPDVHRSRPVSHWLGEEILAC